MKQRLDAIDLSFGERANRLFYLSIAPSFIETISNNIKKLDLAAHPIRIVLLSKTFGYDDKKSAELLNKLLSKTFKEEQIYRIDHYLGKETVQNILAFRLETLCLSHSGTVTSLILYRLLLQKKLVLKTVVGL
jgi:glucose-6-phosphate 1-dehydrogenase